ncbi:unnamed protein product [Didymodactylos carnosus]|uniref:SEA domain-containing protein n=1 Tax=Didymodactylos carnosus TaxID=1234261 RepID=A0A814FIZ2_9BILA|nr:unnamed protein product [Didymodactylos carnosus]CAF1091990.1 unnamed protein product [Didymodactylos carnosus]CAF3755881.1 unnamed protein product [Didymodactylos carnosus]CAF3853520.1 unnamed protein product [Didymodactylos carnosus]
MSQYLVLSSFIAFVLISIIYCDTSVIRVVNSGSTNTDGFDIKITRDGITKWIVYPRSRPFGNNNYQPTEKGFKLSQEFTNTLFNQIEGTMPLNQYPDTRCIKSASFGSTLRVSYNDQTSPDLTCPIDDEKLATLYTLVRDLIKKLYIN